MFITFAIVTVSLFFSFSFSAAYLSIYLFPSFLFVFFTQLIYV